MRRFAPLALSLSILAYVPYSWIITGSSGNPNHQPYAGAPGSMYDAAANPPQASGTVAYDPRAPLPAAKTAIPAPMATPAPAPAQ